MKSILITILFFISVIGYSQIAVLSDKDGFCYVRSSSQKSNNITDTLQNGEMVYCFAPEGNWVEIEYEKGRGRTSGYVYRDRLIYIENYKQIEITSKDSGRVFFFKDSISVELAQKRFDSKKAKLTYAKGDPTFLEKINGEKFWGTDGGIPKLTYKSIKVKIGKQEMSIPKTAFVDLYQPNLLYTKCYYDGKNNILYIDAMNSDGAGGYDVVWKIEKGKYKDRLVVYGF